MQGAEWLVSESASLHDIKPPLRAHCFHFLHYFKIIPLSRIPNLAITQTKKYKNTHPFCITKLGKRKIYLVRESAGEDFVGNSAGRFLRDFYEVKMPTLVIERFTTPFGSSPPFPFLEFNYAFKLMRERALICISQIWLHKSFYLNLHWTKHDPSEIGVLFMLTVDTYFLQM